MPIKPGKRRSFNESWYAGETAITAIGQGFTLVTPLQLANATAKLANPSLSIKPHLLLSIDGIQQEKQEVKEKKQSYSDKNLKWVKTGMVNVTKEGGTAAFLGRKSDYQMASKTGTAQVFGLKKDQEYNENILSLINLKTMLFLLLMLLPLTLKLSSPSSLRMADTEAQ